MKIIFTQDQVDKLNEYQKSGEFHPYTCGKCPSLGIQSNLIATIYGWKCSREGCDYIQNWAHEIPKGTC